MRNGPPSRWSSGGTSDSRGPTPGSAPISRYGGNRQSSYSPPSRWGNTGRATVRDDLDSKFGPKSTWSVRPTPKPAAAEGGAHDTQPPPSGPTRSWGSSNIPSPKIPRLSNSGSARGTTVSSSPDAKGSLDVLLPPPTQDKQSSEKARLNLPQDKPRVNGYRNSSLQVQLPSGLGTEPGVLGHRNPNTPSGPLAPRTRRNDPPPQLSFKVKEEYQQAEQARNIPPFRTVRGGRATDGRRSEVSNGFPSGGAQSSGPELRKQGSINYTREFYQIDPKSNTAVEKGNQSESPSIKTTHSGLGKSIATDRESPIYSTDAPKTPDDTRTFEDRSRQVLRGTGDSSPTQKMSHMIKEVSAAYVPIEDKLPGLAKTEEGSAEQRNVREEEAEVAGFIASDHAAGGLRTRPLTPAELEYERRQSAKARERSRRREFDTRESAILEEGQGPLTGKAAKKAKKAKKREKQVEAAPAMIPLYLPEYISVANLARAVKMRLDDFIVQMQNMGFEDVSYDHVMNAEVAGLIAMEYGYEPIADTSKEEDLFPRYVLIFQFSRQI